MVAQGNHFFYPVRFCIEQSAKRCCQFLFWHSVESTTGTGGSGNVQYWPGIGRTAYDSAMVEKTKKEITSYFIVGCNNSPPN